ncbi:LptF/LptG family permease [Hydrogenimonas cancrithermarum]|uniref:LptF/LptG family permease n=1 Tax=Hydrogenimonas cancrithermarum TaxID=2993563 RepID=UPI0025744C13|nr:LptF/LptG family permease [Hydrogenimonas cancrithermarum]
MRMFRYVAQLYLKHFFIIAFALAFFFAGLDYMQNASKLNGFNIKILYLFYKGSYALNLLFPIALVLSMIVAKMALIRSNALVSFYALGYSKKAVLRPFFWVAFFLTLLYIVMHFTPFVDAELSAKRLLQGKKSENVTRNLFVKYNDSFIYIAQLIPASKEAKDIRVYTTQENGAAEMIYGKTAHFDGESWIIRHAKIVKKPSPKGLGGEGLAIEYKDEIKTLQGFKPKILTSVFEGKRYYTIQDAYEALNLLLTQRLETSKVRSIFYYMVVSPFFAMFLVVIFFLSIPPHARSTNLLWVSFVLTGITLFVWGVIYLLYRISLSGVVLPELGMVATVALLGLGALYSYLFRTNR